MTDLLESWSKETFSANGIAHDVYRKGSGPGVIVISEIPGLTPKVIEFAERVVGLGATAVMPHLFGTPGREPSAGYALGVLSRLCVSREFSILAMGKHSPAVDWLRALAGQIHDSCGGPGVGAVGMCFTGGFALAMAVDHTMVAPVLSQPSLPFGIGSARKADIQMSASDWSAVEAREDLCVLGLRFSGDPMSPGERFRSIRQRLGDRFVAVELDSSSANPYGHPKNAHSVLTEHLVDQPGTPTREALDQALDFFKARLNL